MPNPASVTTSKNTIYLLGQPIYNEDGMADSPIIPGMLVKGFNGLVPNNRAAVRVEAAVALEREEMGRSIDAPYQVGDTVKVGVFHRGARFLGILESGIAVNEGDFVTGSAVAGCLAVGTGANAIGRSLETLAVGTTRRVRVEVI
jgi:hypothetical protein